MNIVPNKLSLAQLFANSNEQFVVPSYQRRYSWKQRQTGALFDDIDFLKENDGHLFGMIILHAGNYNGAFMQPELVDGQQRMTTLTILLKAIEKAYRGFEREETANEIKKMLQSKGSDKIVQNKVLLGELDDPDYKIIMREGDFDEIVNHNLRIASENYDEWMGEFDENQLDDFYHKLINIAVIIRLDVTLAQDAYKLFETINNRGLKLSATDIIKNFLLGHAAKISEPGILDQVKKVWAQIITDLDEINSDNFFRQYFSSVLKRRITMGMLIDEFKTYYVKNVEYAELLGEYEIFHDDEETDEEDDLAADTVKPAEDEAVSATAEPAAKISIVEFLKQIRKASAVYRRIYFVSFDEAWINLHVNNLWRIQSIPTFTFLMHFFQCGFSKKTSIEVLKLIETFMLRRHICEKRTNENDAVFSRMVDVLKQPDDASMIREIKKHFIDYYPEDAEFADKMPVYQFKGKVENRARYILEQLEYHKRGNTQETIISTSEDVHIEHIIPQSIHTKRDKQEYGDWVSYLGDHATIKHKKYVSRIGNLTLLAAPLNIRASNNPFSRKKPCYRDSDLKITQEVANKNDFKFYHVEQRSLEMATMATRIWTIDFNDIIPVEN